MTDNELIKMFARPAEKEKAFRLIVDKYKEKLYWQIRKIVISHDDTDDILQNCFVKIWNALKDFRAESQLFTWLYRIATNEALSFLNNKHKRYTLPMLDYEKQLNNTLEADPYFDGNDIQKKLQKAILTLPEKQRIVFNMKYFDEVKYNDMSVILETSVGALKASYHHAVKKIENYFQND